jgi:hypothetical protein
MNITKKIIAIITVLVFTFTNAFAYDLSDSQKEKSDIVAKKILLLINKKEQKKIFGEKIISQLE